MNRQIVGALGVVLLVGLAGCPTIFGADVDDPDALSEDADYRWDTGQDAFLVINRNNYTAVYNVSAKATGGEGNIELYRTDALAVERPLEIHGLQFQFANGTLIRYIDGEAVIVRDDGTNEPTDRLSVDNTRQRTIIELPASDGQLAFTTPKTGKQIAVETPVHGSYEIALPPNTDAALPLLSQVRPSNDNRREEGDRVHLLWNEIDASVIIVRWYLDRDLWLFGGLTLIAIILGLVGSGYYYLQIQEAKERRQEEGLDIDYDDDRRRPPPGMR